MDEVARGSDLRSGHSISEVTARVRRRCIELQTLGGEVRQVSHKPLWVFPECAASIGVGTPNQLPQGHWPLVRRPEIPRVVSQ